MLFTSLILGFLIGTPFSVIEFKKFIHDLFLVVADVHSGHGKEYGLATWGHLKLSFLHGMGYLVCLCSILGTVLLFKTEFKKALILSSFVLPYYLSISFVYSTFARYFVPLTPFLCIISAYFVVKLGSFIFYKLKLGVLNLWIISISVLIAMPSIYNIFRFDCLLARKDSRLLASDWIEQNIPYKSSVCQCCSSYTEANIRPTIEYLRGENERLTREILERKRGYFFRKLVDYQLHDALKDNSERPRFNLWGYNFKENKFYFAGQPKGDFPDYIILGTKLEDLPNEFISLKKVIIKNYSLLKAFDPYNNGCEVKNIYEKQHAFFLPFAGFRGVKYPGPYIAIYKRVEEVSR